MHVEDTEKDVRKSKSFNLKGVKYVGSIEVDVLCVGLEIQVHPSDFSKGRGGAWRKVARDECENITRRYTFRRCMILVSVRCINREN